MFFFCPVIKNNNVEEKFETILYLTNKYTMFNLKETYS